MNSYIHPFIFIALLSPSIPLSIVSTQLQLYLLPKDQEPKPFWV